MGPHAGIGHFNVLRNLQSVKIGEQAGLGNWNWIVADSAFAADTAGDACTLRQRIGYTFRSHR